MYQYKELYILDFTNIQYYLDFHQIIKKRTGFSRLLRYELGCYVGLFD